MTPPKWVMHAGVAHLLRPRGWNEDGAVTWCLLTIRPRASDFRDAKPTRGERECKPCMEAKTKGDV